jgi:hypothetical protein
MRLPRFRLRTLMAAVAVTAMSAAIVSVAFREVDRLLAKQGAPRATRVGWAIVHGGMMLVIAFVIGAMIVSVAMIPRRLVALRKSLKRRPSDGSA